MLEDWKERSRMEDGGIGCRPAESSGHIRVADATGPASRTDLLVSSLIRCSGRSYDPSDRISPSACAALPVGARRSHLSVPSNGASSTRGAARAFCVATDIMLHHRFSHANAHTFYLLTYLLVNII